MKKEQFEKLMISKDIYTIGQLINLKDKIIEYVIDKPEFDEDMFYFLNNKYVKNYRTEDEQLRLIESIIECKDEKIKYSYLKELISDRNILENRSSEEHFALINKLKEEQDENKIGFLRLIAKSENVLKYRSNNNQIKLMNKISNTKIKKRINILFLVAIDLNILKNKTIYYQLNTMSQIEDAIEKEQSEESLYDIVCSKLEKDQNIESLNLIDTNNKETEYIFDKEQLLKVLTDNNIDEFNSVIETNQKRYIIEFK